MTARIENVVTSGVFSLDGQDFNVDNNVWLVGDDHEVVVINAAHDPAAILAAVGERRLSPSSAPTGTTTTSTRRRGSPRPWAHRSCCTRATRCCGG